MANQLYTIGYGRTSLRSFVETLKLKDVGILADVRSKPFTRKPGFSRPDLCYVLQQANIRYVHIGDLGAANLDAKGEEFYRRDLLNNADRGLVTLEKLLMEGNVTIMCAETDHTICHRSYVAQRMDELHPDEPAVHLYAEEIVNTFKPSKGEPQAEKLF